MSSDFLTKHALHGTRVAMYIVGQEETVGESSVSSGCWGEDSDHKKWMGATYSHVCRAHSLFYHTFQLPVSLDLAQPANARAQDQAACWKLASNCNTLSTNKSLLAQFE